MDNLATSQAFIFVIFIINGILIAFIFDLFRISRKTFKTPDWLTYVEDISFWLISCIILAYSIYTYNNGAIRLYMFIGLIIGAIIYIITISKYVIKIFVTVIDKIKHILQIIAKCAAFPVKLVLKWGRKLLFKPISLVFMNFKRNFAKFLQKNVNNSAKAHK